MANLRPYRFYGETVEKSFLKKNCWLKQRIINSPEPKAQVSVCRGPSTISNKYISNIRRSILIKFHVKHYQVKGKTMQGV